MGNINICFTLESGNELTKILINNGVLRIELAMLIDREENIDTVDREGCSYRYYKTRLAALGLYGNETQINI